MPSVSAAVPSKGGAQWLLLRAALLTGHRGRQPEPVGGPPPSLAGRPDQFKLFIKSGPCLLRRKLLFLVVVIAAGVVAEVSVLDRAKARFCFYIVACVLVKG